MKYNNNRDCNYWELTVVKLLFLIARQNFGNYDGNERAYMHKLREDLFGWKGDGMTEKEVTVDLNELNIDIKQEIIFKSDLNAWIEKKMIYYERMMEETDGYNNVSAKGHLDMLIRLKEWIEQR